MRRRGYDDDLDQPKRSSPYQDLQEQDDDYDDYDDYEDDDLTGEQGGRKSTVRKSKSASVSTRVKLLSVVIALLVIVLIVLVVVKFTMGSGSKTPGYRAFSDGDSADGADNLAVFHCVCADFSGDECAYGRHGLYQ